MSGPIIIITFCLLLICFCCLYLRYLCCLFWSMYVSFSLVVLFYLSVFLLFSQFLIFSLFPSIYLPSLQPSLSLTSSSPFSHLSIHLDLCFLFWSMYVSFSLVVLFYVLLYSLSLLTSYISLALSLPLQLLRWKWRLDWHIITPFKWFSGSWNLLTNDSGRAQALYPFSRSLMLTVVL